MMLKWSWAGALKKYISQAGLTIKPATILLLMVVLGFTAYLFVGYLYQQAVFSIVGAVIAALVPFAVIAWKRNKRMGQFEEHLPEALDLLGRAVRAGHSFTTGLELIAQECGEPIAGEFRTTFEEQNLGLPLRDSLLNLTERVPLVDVRLLVTALLIQKDSGGNLAEILDELSRVIRERFRIYREVKVKTAQGRLTAAILIAMPLIMLAALGALNPGYIRVLFVDPTGQHDAHGCRWDANSWLFDAVEDRQYRSLSGVGATMIWLITLGTFLATMTVFVSLFYAFTSGESGIAQRLSELADAPDANRHEDFAERQKERIAGAYSYRSGRLLPGTERISRSAAHDDPRRVSRANRHPDRAGAEGALAHRSGQRGLFYGDLSL